MKVLVFGTGEIYHKHKNHFAENVMVIGFLDNNPSKHNQILDGCTIYMPQEVARLEFDYIFLMSVQQADMREQLHALAVPDDKILDMNHRGNILQRKKTEIYGNIDYDQARIIAVFTHSLVSTGAQNSLFTLVMTLKKRYNIVIVSLEDGTQREKYLDNHIPVIVSEDIIEETGLLGRLADSADMFWVNTAWLYYIADYLRRFSKSIFWWLHETITEHDISKRIFFNIALDVNVRILSVSSLIDENIAQTYGDWIKPNRLLFGIEDYTAERKVRKKKSEKITLVCIGGISRIKGQDILVEAVNRLPQSYKDRLSVLIVGRGVFGKHEKKIISQNECITFVGEVDHDWMAEIYEAVDGIVCCSRKESVSVVVAEACMNGKFSIVSDCAGITDYMMDGVNGFIFESENVDELFNKLIFVMDHFDYAYKIGKASREIYDKNFTMTGFEKTLRGYIG